MLHRHFQQNQRTVSCKPGVTLRCHCWASIGTNCLQTDKCRLADVSCMCCQHDMTTTEIRMIDHTWLFTVHATCVRGYLLSDDIRALASPDAERVRSGPAAAGARNKCVIDRSCLCVCVGGGEHLVTFWCKDAPVLHCDCSACAVQLSRSSRGAGLHCDAWQYDKRPAPPAIWSLDHTHWQWRVLRHKWAGVATIIQRMLLLLRCFFSILAVC